MNKEKSKKGGGGFIKQLVERYVRLKKLSPNEICIFNVITTQGSYQVTIGPEYKPGEARKLRVEQHSRTLEINGSIHHLFINREKISALPEHKDVRQNFRDSIIMKDISVHIFDNDGNGYNIRFGDRPGAGLSAKQKINLAGDKGEEILSKHLKNGYLIKETYKIIQEDILKTLKKYG